MSFLTRIGYLETAEAERDRLAACPEGSINHELSKLPVTITGPLQDLLIELPWKHTERGEHRRHRVVVVPFEYRGDSRPESEQETLPRRRHAGWWACAVVASDHPSYPVGGYRLSIPTAELVRGRHIDLFAEMTPNAVA